MKNIKFLALSFTLLIIGSVAAHAASLASAKVVRIEGIVTKFSKDGQTNLKKGDVLKEGDTINVRPVSSVDLVFSNGSELTVVENTSLEFSELQQEQFSGNKSYEQLQADPSKSQTVLTLNYGKVDGHVKKLQSDSKFHVKTPLGTAAIRGTRFSATLIYIPARNEFRLVVSNRDGAVDLISRFAGTVTYNNNKKASKSFDSQSTEVKTEIIPAEHEVSIRIQEGDPFFEELRAIIQEAAPNATNAIVTPVTVIVDDDEDGDGQDDDLGVIVVSPEGGSQ